MTGDDRPPLPPPEFATFAIEPTEAELARVDAPDAPKEWASYNHAGLYSGTAVDELAVLYEALRLLDDPEYEARQNRELLEDVAADLGESPPAAGLPPIPDHIKAANRADILREIERVKTRRAARVRAAAVPPARLPEPGE